MAEVDENLLKTIPGAQALIAWFGHWPSFHDAEIISLLLDRESDSVLKIHTFNVLREVNEKGYFRTQRHALVCFLMSDIEALHLANLNAQNVIFGLSLSKAGELIAINLDC